MCKQQPSKAEKILECKVENDAILFSLCWPFAMKYLNNFLRFHWLIFKATLKCGGKINPHIHVNYTVFI